MNRNSIQISLPTPCHESWGKMGATERGAFCSSCQKEVVDFSAMTDREVIESLSRNKLGCGRFRKDQVNTNLRIAKVDNGFFKWRALFLGALSFISFRSFSFASDQAKIIKTEKRDSLAKSPADTTHTGKPIISAVEIKDTLIISSPAVAALERKDTAPIHPIDTTIVLKDIEVLGCIGAEHYTMGIAYKFVPVTDTLTEDVGRRTRFMNINYPSRRQELRAWFRHFFHLD